jgi:membrane protein required for colicin V production
MIDFTLLDYIYIGVALASTAWAFSRGGVYELVATISWAAAAVASRFVSPWLNELFQKLFSLSDASIGSLIASYFIVFFGVLVIFGLFNQKLRDWIQDSILQITDRTLGIIFGILRAIIIMGLFYWVLLWYYDGAIKPTFLTHARTRPMMQVTAVKLADWFMPVKSELLERDRAAEELFQNLIDPVIRAAATRPGAGEQDAEFLGYVEAERMALENQILQLTNMPEFEFEEEPEPEPLFD